ncbi:MAG: PAS domain S-box protein [Lentisphaerae bacterium]|nr:PAS domain S-box protein [Lentisphaerota bacterium]
MADLLDRSSQPFGVGYPDGRLGLVNQAFCELLGYTKEDLQALTWAESLTPAEWRGVESTNLAALRRTGEPVRYEKEYLRRDGGRVLVELLVHEIRDAQGAPYCYYAFVTDISERRRVEQALRASRDFAEKLVQTANAIILGLNTAGEITIFNEAAEQITGYRRDELVGRNWFDMLVPRDRYPAVWAVFSRLVTDGLSRQFENPILTKSGTERFISWQNSVLEEGGRVIGTLSCGIDITERRQVEVSLRASEAKYRRLHESMTDAYVCVDMQGRVIEWNRAYLEMVGYGDADLRGLTYAELTPAKWHAMEERIVQEQILPRGHSEVYEKEYLRRDGSVFPVELRTFLLRNEGGDPASMWAIVRDITERQRAAEERMVLESKMLQAQKLESLGVLAGGIAHDFNNLLMAIMGNADLALDDLSDLSPAKPMLQEINKASQRAADLCQQMLAYAGRGSLAVSSFDLSELIVEMGQMLAVSVSKKAALQYQLASGVALVEADATQLRQVVMNLIINASEAIGERGGVITVTTDCAACDQSYLQETLWSDQLAAGDYIRLRVSDTGCGMDRATQLKIFDPFFTTKFAGRGLGLAAVLGIVRGHKGTIRVTSEPGLGTTFEILLPASDQVRGRGVAAVGTSRPTPWRGEGTILLVDDEEAVRDLARRMLERLGFQVLLATDGRQALELFRARHADIRVVILDLTMPHMDGAEALLALRAIDPSVRVMMSSGFNERDVQQRFGERGAAGFIQKPYQLARLSDTLRRVLDGPA